MKRCLKSQPEPEALADYRGGAPNGSWEQFRQCDPEGYKAIRCAMRADQGGLCAYCEMRVEPDNEQVAHFHPKSDTSGPHNWALDWGNLWLACKGGSQTWLPGPYQYLPPLPENLSCDERKGSGVLDGIVFAPCEVPAVPLIFRFEQHPDRIEIHVNKDGCAKAGVDIGKAQRTIDEFNLNCTRLASARLAVHRELERAIALLRESHVDPRDGLDALIRRHLARDANGYWPQFFTLVRWRFGQAAESYLQAIGYEG